MIWWNYIACWASGAALGALLQSFADARRRVRETRQLRDLGESLAARNARLDRLADSKQARP